MPNDYVRRETPVLSLAGQRRAVDGQHCANESTVRNAAKKRDLASVVRCKHICECSLKFGSTSLFFLVGWSRYAEETRVSNKDGLFIDLA